MRDIDVFISYSRQDKSFVNKLSDRLKKLGLKVWFDAELHAGDEFIETINQALSDAKVVLAIWSEQSVQSKWVRAEALDGFHRDQFAALRIDNCIVPVPFSSSNYIQVEELDEFLVSESLKRLALRLAEKSNNQRARFLIEVAPKEEPELSRSETPIFSLPQKANGECEYILVGGGSGSGASNFAISLANQLAGSKRVLLVDGDINGASIDVHLGIAPENDIAAVISGWIEIGDAFTRIDAPIGSFDLFSGRSASGALFEATAEELFSVMSQLYQIPDFDIVIIDSTGFHGDYTRALYQLADKFLVVCSDDPVSMTRAYTHIKVAKGYSPSTEQQLVVNRYITPAAGMNVASAIRQACETFLAFRPRLLGVLPNVEDMREFNRSQNPIFNLNRDHPYSQRVAEIAGNIISRNTMNKVTPVKAELGRLETTIDQVLTKRDSSN